MLEAETFRTIDKTQSFQTPLFLLNTMWIQIVMLTTVCNLLNKTLYFQILNPNCVLYLELALVVTENFLYEFFIEF